MSIYSLKSTRLFVLLFLLIFTATLQADDKWNVEAIDWLTLESALDDASNSKKKIMLVLHSEGCGACDDYSKLFREGAVAIASKDLLMVLIDDDADEDISEKYSLDGSYVPRTYFLNSDGSVMDVRVGKEGDRFQYYYGRGAPLLAEIMSKVSGG